MPHRITDTIAKLVIIRSRFATGIQQVTMLLNRPHQMKEMTKIESIE